MAEVVSSLAAFEERNPFEPLQLLNDESVADVETPEKILERITRHASEHMATEFVQKSNEDAYELKKRSFQEGELDDSWTIVASRRTRRKSRMATPLSPSSSSEDERPRGKPYEKPNKTWKRSIVAIGTAAAVGLVSFLINRRLRRNKD